MACQFNKDVNLTTPASHDDHELLGAALDATGICISILDEGGNFIRANHAFCRLFGYASQELIAQQWPLLAIAEDEFPGAGQERRRMRRKDGSLLTATVGLKPVTLAHGARYIIMTVTEYPVPQEAPHSKDLYRQVVENVSEAIIVAQDERLIYANSRAVELFGYMQSELTGMPIATIVHPDDLPRVLERYRRRLSGLPAERHASLRMMHKGGQAIWVESSSVRIDWEERPATLVFLADQSGWRKQQEALIKSEEHHRQVVDNALEGIIVVQDGKVVFANTRMLHLVGLAPQELVGHSLLTEVHEEDRHLVSDRYTRRMRGEDVDTRTMFRMVHRRTGNIAWIEISSVIIEWEGRPATLSFINDITERKRLEDSLQQNIAERIRLETLQIQGELKEAELARRHAEETTRAKSMFLANMSHEIRTPMNAIIGMAHLALRTSLDARQRDYIEKIRGAGISLLGIINDILDFSKIEAGKLDMEHTVFNLDDVLGNVSTVTGVKAHEKGLEYLFQVPLDIPRRLIGDPLRLGQILINLINNAIKFTDKGEVHVVCSKRETSYEKILLHFQVRDTGIGMSEEQTARLFRAFSQADESTTRKYGGTGLGLSIAKRLVELMGGTIWLESKVDVGTTIHFTAWFGTANAMEQRHVIPAAINGMRALVVDDNPSARNIIAQSLAALPIDIDVAASASAALAMIRTCDRERPYSVIFTDLQMPGMDGIDLICAVKNDASLPSPPRMILLSSHSREETRYRLETVQADAFLMKPVSASMLVDMLMELFAPHVRDNAPQTSVLIPRFRDLTVLLVEDNDINQQIAAELMQAAGIEVDIAGNGRIALEKLAAAGTGHYNLVFMDVQMPEMDGHETTRRIRADARFNALPIIAMTAHAIVEERERCFANGMNDHLAKPIDPALLYQALSRWCPYHVMQEGAALAVSEAGPGGDEMTIDGFDVRDGMKRMLGDFSFYLRMLARFRDGQRDAVVDIRRALDHDREAAERFTHTLRGVAAQVSATAVVALADKLETAIHEGEPLDLLTPLMDQLDAAMSAARRALSAVLPEPARVTAVSSDEMPDRNQIQQAIDRFATLLRAYDAEAIDMLDGLSPLLLALIGETAFERLQDATRCYDFDAAFEALTAGMQDAGYKIQQVQ